MGVDVRLNTAAGTLEPSRLALSDGSIVSAETIVWAAGVEAPAVVAAMDAPHGAKGSLAVDEYLQVRQRNRYTRSGTARTLKTVAMVASFHNSRRLPSKKGVQ
jgi:NAD(P)H-nitrite reductase large subunit